MLLEVIDLVGIGFVYSLTLDAWPRGSDTPHRSSEGIASEMIGKKLVSASLMTWAMAGGVSTALAEFHTVRFVDPSAVPTAHLPDIGGILYPTSHNFQEDGVHVEAIWAPSTHNGLVQGHFHHLEYGFETSHGFGVPDAQGSYDISGFYLRMVDGRPFSLRSIDYRLRVQLQNTDILVSTTFDPTLPFLNQFVHFPVGRFSTFRTLNITGFENVNQVYLSSILTHPNYTQIQIDNIVIWTDDTAQGACCASAGIGCDVATAEDCDAAGGTYLGDDTVCLGGAYCPTTVGACCSPDAVECAMTQAVDCNLPDSVFAGVGSICGTSPVCPLATGRCCIDNGDDCIQVLSPACVGADTYFHGAGTQCTDPGDCFVPCDSNADCDDANPCNGFETCDLPTGECQVGAPPDCDDDDACNGVETCDPATGLCEPGVDLDCDDGEVCTTDSCDPTLGCSNIAPDCDDGNPCTDDSCSGGECVHTAVNCDDGIACTIDACDSNGGACVHSPSHASCDDGVFCNGSEVCSTSGGCQAGANPCPGQNCDEGSDQCIANQPSIWLVFSGDTVVPGVGTVRNEDIVEYDPNTGAWSFIFDGSDVGLGSLAIDGLTLLPGGDLLLSFTAPGNVPALIGGPNGLAVDGADLVRFTPTSLGSTTAGTLTFYFDGSDVGLDTTSENIDALSVAPDGRLIISTTANLSVPGVSGVDEDLFIFNATSLGATTAGTFEMYFDGSDVGLDTTVDEDVDAASSRPYGGLLLSTVGPFSVTGASGGDQDPFGFTPTQLGATTSGTFELVLDLSTVGIDPAAHVEALEEVP